MTITARTLLQDALLDIGAIGEGETAGSSMTDSGLRVLNRIIDGWRAQRLFIHAQSTISASFSGASATVGAGLTIDTDAPLRFMPGSYYLKGSESYPLADWTAEQYSAISDKTEAGEYPEGFYFDRKVPGEVRVWPVPTAAVAYRFLVMAKLSKFADLDTEYSLPDGYEDALHYTLCERLPTSYNLPIDPANAGEARRARKRLRTNNVQIPILSSVEVGDPYHNIING